MGRPRKTPSYTVESVEAALDVHVPGAWRRQPVGWQVDTQIGTLCFTTLKEIRAFVCGAAVANQHARAAS